MKTVFICLSALLLFTTGLFAQGQWEARTALPTGPRERPFYFTIDDKMYVGTGRGYRGGGFDPSFNESDVWSYEFATDSWTELNPFPGEAFRNGASFVIDGIAYVVTGHNGQDYIDPFWKYDPATDSWEELPPFPGGKMSFPTTFSLNGKGYVVLGGIGADQPANSFYSTTLWEYDPLTESWTEKSSFPGLGRWRAFAFVIDGQAYVGGGSRENESSANLSDCYRYDPSSDSWSPIADFPEGYGLGGFSFAIDGKGYVGEGARHLYAENYGTRVWEYDPGTDSWAHVSNTPGSQLGRILTFSATYQGKAYVGGGRNYGDPTLAPMYGDFYQWDKDAPAEIPEYETWASLGRGPADDGQVAIHALQALNADTIWALPTATFTFSEAPLELMLTHDGGNSWQTLTVDTTSGFTVANLFAQDSREVWVTASLSGGETFVYHTADGGQSWEKKLDAADNILAEGTGIHFFDEDNGLLWGNDAGLFSGGSLKVYRTTDGGQSWEQVDDPSLPAPQNEQYHFPAAGNNAHEIIGDTVWIPAVGGIYRSTDRGQNWSSATLAPWPFSIAFENARRGMAVSDNMPGELGSRAFFTEDGGESWTEADMPKSPVATGIEYIPGTDGGYLAYGARFPDQKMSYTPNSGQDWLVFEAPPALNTIHFLSADVGFGGGPLLKDIPVGVYRWQGAFDAIGRLYVKADATGANTGKSWEDAFTTLQAALAVAKEGNTIWIAEGTYYTDPGRSDNSQSFRIDKNLKIYGGFAGTEEDLSERSLGDHLTILSGDLNQDDSPSDTTANRTDNARHVVIIDSTITNATVLDGLTIAGGAAREMTGGEDGSDVVGGGMYVLGGPVVQNCTLENNYAAEDGAGIYLHKHVGIADQPVIKSCHFFGNTAEGDGGALLTRDPVAITGNCFEGNRANYRGGGIYHLGVTPGSTSYQDNRFTENTATLGGGIYLQGSSANSSYSFSGNIYEGNVAVELIGNVGTFVVGGGASIFIDENSPANQISIERDTFRQNTASNAVGGLGISLAGPAAGLQISHSVFTENSSGFIGGAARVVAANTANASVVRLDNCRFNNNTAPRGGGMEILNAADFSSVELSDSEFTGNTSSSNQQNGGGMNIIFLGEDQSISIKRSDFIGNAGGFLGGGISMLTDNGVRRFSFLLDSCSFVQNTSTEAGGGIAFDLSDGLVEEADLKILNSVFQNNTAAIFGGGLAMASYGEMVPDEIVEVGSCQFIDNESGRYGGGVAFALDDNLQLSIMDCFFEDNQATAAGGGMYLNGTSVSAFNVDLSHSTFERNQCFRGAAVATDNLYSAAGNTGIPENAQFSIENTLMTDNSGNSGTISCRTLENLALTNNTIANNMANGIRLETQSGIILQNNILYNPGFTEYQSLADDGSALSMGGNLLSDPSLVDIATSQDKQMADPLFEGAGSYQLQQGSPAIDAGVSLAETPEFDLAGNPRVQGSAIDMGALESPFVSTTRAQFVDNNFLTIAPNPVSAEMTVQINNDWKGLLQLQICDALGKEVLRHRFRKSTADWQEQLDVSRLPAGAYYLLLSNGRQFTQQPFVIGK